VTDEEHVTLGDLLSRLAEREQYQRDMRRASDIMDRMQREDPATWQEYVSELRVFEAGTACDEPTAAAADSPEYNDAGNANTGDSTTGDGRHSNDAGCPAR
jgi:hypothetical protein